jgi:hypothetical protein
MSHTIVIFSTIHYKFVTINPYSMELILNKYGVWGPCLKDIIQSLIPLKNLQARSMCVCC